MTLLPLRYCAALAGVALATFAVFLVAGRQIEAQDARADREGVENASAIIGYRTDGVEASLEDVAALFSASNHVTGPEFGRFAAGPLERPGVHSVGWIEKVNRADRRGFERASRSRITEFASRGRLRPAGDRDVYFPVGILKSPPSKARPVVGFDGWSEPLRHRTMRAAALAGEPRATPPIKLAGGASRPLYYMPVYKPGMSLSTPALRWRAVDGFVLAAIDTRELMSEAARRLPGAPGVRIMDGAREVLSMASRDGSATTATIDVGGRPWQLEVVRDAGADPAGRLRWTVTGVGLLLLLSLWRLFTRAARQTAEAEALVAVRTAELADRNGQLVELDAFKDQMIGLVSHDLRSPLTAIHGYVDLLLEGEGGPLSDDQRRWLTVARRSASRLENRIDDLLLVSQINDGRLHPERRPSDVSAIARDVVEAATPLALRKPVQFALDADDECVASIDPHLVGQTLENLISNAIKYTPEGGRVDVAVRCGGDSVLIEVADTGIGIDSGALDDVFEPFVRTREALDRNIRGTGLGLVIVKAVAEAHGGSASVTSAPGRGSTFRVELPIAAGDRVPAHPTLV